jgi:hypothetical protein
MKWAGVIVITIVVAIIVWAATSQSSAQKKESFVAQRNCNTFNLAGNYPYSAFGTILPDHPLGYPPGPYNSAGIVTLDPSGNYTASAKTSLSGTMIDEEFSGAYTIGQDCSVTLMSGEVPITITYGTDDRKLIYGVVLLPKTNISIIGARK